MPRGAASSPNGRSCRVAVIGGGPAGVACCRFLRDYGHEPLVFEAGEEVGGVWASDPTNKVVYNGLVTNIPKVMMQSFDLDFPAHLPSYIPAADLGRYISDYADHFGLRRFIQHGARVTCVEALRSEAEEADGDSRWRVAWQQRGREPESQDFDAVVVATGHYETPYLPEIPGQGAWLAAEAAPGQRRLAHSREYTGPDQYAGRVVLIVGGRASAVDIARGLRGVARWVYVLYKGCDEVETVGSCTRVPLGTELTADGQLVSQGCLVPGPSVEELVLATGYTYTFPFLDEAALGLECGPHRRYVQPLFLHVVHANRPSLGFVGIPLAVPTLLPLFEAQARLFAAHLRQPCTSTAERQAWVASKFASVGDRPQDLHMLGPNIAFKYLEELAMAAGLRDKELEFYVRRVSLLEEVYTDRRQRYPKLPWDDDSYRLCEYIVDWEAGSWQVFPPDASAGG